jgi:hypothetical protein
MSPDRLLGRPLDSLTVKERWELAGNWVALPLYRPDGAPLRFIEVVGRSAHDCRDLLRKRGLDPADFEFCPIAQPYRP